MTTYFDNIPDDFDALIASPDTARPGELKEIPLVAYGKVEPCHKCSGTGQFKSWSGRIVGTCHACKGVGKMTFKNAPEVRAALRAKSAARKVVKAQEATATFAEQHPAVWAWLDGNTFEFAVAMREAIARFGSLTENQLAACVRLIAKRDAGKLAAQARVDNAQDIDVSKLTDAFAVASSRLKSPKLRFAGFAITPAKATSANPGALYVKAGETYLGKIAGGKFIRSRDCSDEVESQFRCVAADPKKAANEHSLVTGSCAVCGRHLTAKESTARGIGPICADKFGW